MTGLGTSQRLGLWFGLSIQLVIVNPRPQGATKIACGPVLFPDVSCESTTCSWVTEEAGYENLNKNYKRICSPNAMTRTVESRRKTRNIQSLRSNKPVAETSKITNATVKLSTVGVVSEKPRPKPKKDPVKEPILQNKNLRGGAPPLRQEIVTTSTDLTFVKKLRGRTKNTQTDKIFLHQFEQAFTNADFQLVVLP